MSALRICVKFLNDCNRADEIHFVSRVPCKTEILRIKDSRYIVNQVTHITDTYDFQTSAQAIVEVF